MAEPGTLMALDGETLLIHARGQDWLSTWHPPHLPPDGKNHGSEAVCVTPEGMIVLVSQDGRRWVMPAGRPEADEDLRATMVREVFEEACARVESATLLGFGRGECRKGHEKGLVLVRSLWHAHVSLEPWQPQHEMVQRQVVSPQEARTIFASIQDPFLPFHRRAFHQAGII